MPAAKATGTVNVERVARTGGERGLRCAEARAAEGAGHGAATRVAGGRAADTAVERDAGGQCVGHRHRGRTGRSRVDDHDGVGRAAARRVRRAAVGLGDREAGHRLRVSLSAPEPVAPEAVSVADAVFTSGSSASDAAKATGAVSTSALPAPAPMPRTRDAERRLAGGAGDGAAGRHTARHARRVAGERDPGRQRIVHRHGERVGRAGVGDRHHVGAGAAGRVRRPRCPSWRRRASRARTAHRCPGRSRSRRSGRRSRWRR